MSNTFKNFRTESRDTSWGANTDKLTLEQINAGSLLRIADAAEAMSKNHKDLVAEIERLKHSRDYWQEEAQGQKRTAAGLRGVITKQRVIIAELGQRAR